MPAAARPATIAAGMGSLRRKLLLAVAALLSASALLAVTILLVGHFGETEGRLLATTALLAGYGLVAMPSAMLLDRRRAVPLATAGLALAGAGALLSLVAVWSGEPSPRLGKVVGTVTAFALATAQTSALAVRSGRGPAAVRRLFALSCLLAGTAAALFAAMLWAEADSDVFARFLAALVVLDLLVVALQPLLAMLRGGGALHRLRVGVDPGGIVELEVEAADRAAAAAKAIRSLERRGRRVRTLEFAGPQVSAPRERRAAGTLLGEEPCDVRDRDEAGEPPVGEHEAAVEVALAQLEQRL
jgi:hypothetical protein